jgi:predicted patatin/cPLA2 family phospholipase
MRLLAALLVLPVLTLTLSGPASSQQQAAKQRGAKRDFAKLCAAAAFAKANPKRCAKFAAQKTASPEPAKPPELPSRPDFTADDQEVASIAGIPGARFWADSEKDFLAVLPQTPGPWLVLSTGGGDGAFGAGLLNGWSESGKRPAFSVVTGVSTGALMAPYAFVGPAQDAGLKRAYTEYNAGDIFEDVKTPESLVDTWPLKRLIGKEVTPELLKQVAEAHNSGRRLLIATTNLDAQRGVVWNMGAIAAKGDDAALKLFRDVLAASTAIPGLFPPVMIEVEANGKKTQEMHADGGLSAQIFLAPESMLNSTSKTKIPASELYLIANNRLNSEFQMTERSLIFVLGHAIAVGVQSMLRMNIDRAYAAATRDGVPFYLSYPALGADQQGKGAFDTEFMKSLFENGVTRGKTGEPFARDVADALRPPRQVAPSPRRPASDRK